MPTTSKSPTTTDGPWGENLVRRRLPSHHPPTHPGEMLVEEFLKPLGVTQTAFAARLGVSFPRLNEIVNGKRGVTPDTALRLARVTGMSADFWLGLQQDWDLSVSCRTPVVLPAACVPIPAVLADELDAPPFGRLLYRAWTTVSGSQSSRANAAASRVFGVSGSRCTTSSTTSREA